MLVVYILATIGGIAVVLDAPAIAHVRDGRPARAAERGGTELGARQRVANRRPGARRDHHRRRGGPLLHRQHDQLPCRPRRAALDAHRRAVPGRSRSHGHAPQGNARGARLCVARPTGARRARRDDIVGLVGFNFNTLVPLLAGHAPRRRARVRAPLGRVRPGSVRRRHHHCVAQARHLQGVRSGMLGFSVLRSSSPRSTTRGCSARPRRHRGRHLRSSPPTRTRSCSLRRPTTSGVGSSLSTSSRSSASRRSDRCSRERSRRARRDRARLPRQRGRRPRGDPVRYCGRPRRGGAPRTRERRQTASGRYRVCPPMPKGGSG